LHALTAAAEVDFLVSLQPVPVRKRGSVQLEVELTGVLDLSDLSPLASVGIERRELLGPNIDASRLIGHAVSWLGYAGLLVPSARHSGTNLVIYTERMAPTDRVDVAR
jgi:RES domain-containing protein